MESVILVGSDVSEENWTFLKGLEDSTKKKWQIKKCITNNFKGINKITRYIKFFLMPIHLLVQRKNYEDILSWQQFFGLVLAFYCRFFHVKEVPRLNIMTFIYKPKGGLIGEIYFRFIKYAVTSKYINAIFVYSRSEVEYYAHIFGIPKERFKAVKLGIDDKYDEYKNDKGEYYIAPGRSNRDYDFLKKSWPKDEQKLYIVCDLENDEKVAENIVIKNNCFGHEYMQLLAKSKGVIIPLQDENLSSGQLVFLQAAMMGKPVITTINSTVQDYVINEVTGFIIDKSKESLVRAVARLDNSTEYNRISVNARKHFINDFSLYNLGVCVGNELI